MEKPSKRSESRADVLADEREEYEEYQKDMEYVKEELDAWYQEAYPIFFRYAIDDEFFWSTNTVARQIELGKWMIERIRLDPEDPTLNVAENYAEREYLRALAEAAEQYQGARKGVYGRTWDDFSKVGPADLETIIKYWVLVEKRARLNLKAQLKRAQAEPEVKEKDPVAYAEGIAEMYHESWLAHVRLAVVRRLFELKVNGSDVHQWSHVPREIKESIRGTIAGLPDESLELESIRGPVKKRERDLWIFDRFNSLTGMTYHEKRESIAEELQDIAASKGWPICGVSGISDVITEMRKLQDTLPQSRVTPPTGS